MSESQAERDARLRAAVAKARAEKAARETADQQEPPVLRTGKGLTDGGTEG